MRKNSYRSRVANISGAWSPSAISGTRAANSAFYTPVHPKGQQEVVLKQSSVGCSQDPRNRSVDSHACMPVHHRRRA